MAIPILPIVVISLGLFALTRRGGSKTDDEPVVEMDLIPIPTTPPRPPLYPSRTPGRMCRTKGGRAAWDDSGVCKKFWIEGETDEAIAKLAREEWELRGSPTFSNLCLTVEDPLGGEFAAPIDNPVMVEIVAASLERYYDVGPLWPPKDDNIDGDKRSPHWVWMSWASAMTAVKKELCGL